MAPTIEEDHLQSLRPAVALPALLGILFLGYTLSSVIYNLFFSSLRSIPGPKLWATSQIFYSRMILSGTGHKKILDLHKKYGDVVRVAPNQVSFTDTRAWREVYGHRKAGQLENQRDPTFYKLAAPGMIGPISSEDHSRQRRILSHAFSAQSMADQQPLIQGYVDLLVTKLKERSPGSAKHQPSVDIVKWFNYTTFDVIGDLAFGEPFGCLNDSAYHPWVALIFASIKQSAWMGQLRRIYPGLEAFLRGKFAAIVLNKRVEHNKLVQVKVEKRIALGQYRPDFMQSMLAKSTEGKDKLTPAEIQSNASLLILAGSETTATALSGATYLLCTHPQVMAKLANEVRSAFTSEDEITLLSVQRLKYMLAVLDETLRMFPPVPGIGPRVIRTGGGVICDRFLPEGTIANIWQWAMNYNPTNFILPESFAPERWLGDSRFSNDRKDGFQPFMYGARNCIGKNLAYAEMRLILARIVWNFNIEMVNPNEKWIDNNKVYNLWEKSPLNVHLIPRKAE